MRHVTDPFRIMPVYTSPIPPNLVNMVEGAYQTFNNRREITDQGKVLPSQMKKFMIGSATQLGC